MPKPPMYFDFFTGFGSRPTLYERLLAQGTMVGRDLAVTNTRTGGRLSAFADNTIPNMPNLVPAEVDSWTIGLNSTRTNEGGGVYLFESNATSNSFLRYVYALTTGKKYTFVMEFKDCTDESVYIPMEAFGASVRLSDATTTAGTNVTINSATRTAKSGGWVEIEVHFTANTTDAGWLAFCTPIDAADGFSFRIQSVRLTQSTLASPPFPIGSAAGAVLPDELVINNRLYAYASMNGATNLVSTVVSDAAAWVPSSGSITVADQGGGVYRITSNTDPTAIANTIATASIDRNSRCQARLISGGAVSANSYFSFRNATTKVGTSYLLSNLTAEWQDINCSVSSGTQSTNVAFRSDSGESIVFEVRYIRAVDSTVAHAASPDGSAAGASCGSDNLTATYSSTNGTAVVFAKFYDGASTAGYRRMFDLGGAFNGIRAEVFTDGFVTTYLHDTTYAQTAALEDDDNVGVISFDWNGSEVGARLNDSSRVEDPTTYVPSGLVSYGESHVMWGAIIFENRRLSQSEFNALRAGIKADLAADFGGFR